MIRLNANTELPFMGVGLEDTLKKKKKKASAIVGICFKLRKSIWGGSKRGMTPKIYDFP